jgi:hypothetical protein
LPEVDVGPATNYSAQWKAFLRPAPAGGAYAITARCIKNCGTGTIERDIASIERVTFGDVFFCR